MLHPSTSVSTAPDRRPEVLVSGAGFAGLSMAFWLNRLGYRVTVVEIASGLRRGGTPVDIEGETIAILVRMGMLDAVRAKALPPRGFEFKNADDVTVGALGAGADSNDAAAERHEIHRDDLLDILFAAVQPDAEVRFGRSISRLESRSDIVSATFDDGSSQDYCLIFGCDGNRSNTRRLVFGDEKAYVHFMGGYFLLKVASSVDLLPANVSQVYSVPGRTAILNGYHDRTDVGLAFRSERQIAYDRRNRAEQRDLIHTHFDELGWKIPAMLSHVDDGGDFYFDRINQIRMPCWSKDRTALVGDAGYCVSPVAGFGGSMAIIGAGRLAEALQRHPGDHAAAFRDYEDGLRPFVEEVQERAATEGMSVIFPADEASLTERDRKLQSGRIDL